MISNQHAVTLQHARLLASTARGSAAQRRRRRRRYRECSPPPRGVPPARQQATVNADHDAQPRPARAAKGSLGACRSCPCRRLKLAKGGARSCASDYDPAIAGGHTLSCAAAAGSLSGRGCAGTFPWQQLHWGPSHSPSLIIARAIYGLPRRGLGTQLCGRRSGRTLPSTRT